MADSCQREKTTPLPLKWVFFVSLFQGIIRGGMLSATVDQSEIRGLDTA